MRCPRCETSVLDEREREGVTVDVCRECRGMWLDRGELEKIIARERRYEDHDERDRDDDDERSRERALRNRRPDDDDDRRGDYRPRYKRRKSWFESLGDIFD